MSASVLAGNLTPNHIGKQAHIAVEGVEHEGELDSVRFHREYKSGKGKQLTVDITLTNPGRAWTFLHVPVDHIIELVGED